MGGRRQLWNGDSTPTSAAVLPRTVQKQTWGATAPATGAIAHSARHLQRLTGTDLVCGFSYSRLSPDKAELDMCLFAERVMPVM
jgi:hypothetical protein